MIINGDNVGILNETVVAYYKTQFSNPLKEEDYR
jgi:hypothetical protein